MAMVGAMVVMEADLALDLPRGPIYLPPLPRLHTLVMTPIASPLLSMVNTVLVAVPSNPGMEVRMLATLMALTYQR